MKVVHVFCRLEKVFDRVPRKVMQWAMRKKGIIGWISDEPYPGSKMKVKLEFNCVNNLK